jgi:hypothetical protein
VTGERRISRGERPDARDQTRAEHLVDHRKGERAMTPSTLGHSEIPD